MYVWMKFSNLIVPIRPSEADEIEGLDATQLGVQAYPEFTGTDEKAGKSRKDYSPLPTT
jgi:ammonia channel protein AmtB